MKGQKTTARLVQNSETQIYGLVLVWGFQGLIPARGSSAQNKYRAIPASAKLITRSKHPGSGGFTNKFHLRVGKGGK